MQMICLSTHVDQTSFVSANNSSVVRSLSPSDSPQTKPCADFPNQATPITNYADFIQSCHNVDVNKVVGIFLSKKSATTKVVR